MRSSSRSTVVLMHTNYAPLYAFVKSRRHVRAARRGWMLQRRRSSYLHGGGEKTAWILGGAFGQTPKYWLNLQATHDLTRTRPARPVARMPEAIKAAGTVRRQW
jgi:hypothetical protein